MAAPNADPPGPLDRWALVVGSVAMTVIGSALLFLMFGAIAAGVDWLAPLLSLVVLTFAVMAIPLAAAAILAKRERAWLALAFAVLPCLAVLATWVWAIHNGRWGPGG